MKYTISQKRALKRLGIPDFNHMTKDKVTAFVSMIPYMDPEVAKAALAQFPEFKDLALGAVTELKNIMDTLIASNDNSQGQFYAACNSIITSLKQELENENIDSEERDRIENKMITVARMIGEKDSENKRFYKTILASVGAAVVAIVSVGGALLGANLKAPFGSDDNDVLEGEYEDIIDV